MDLLTIVLALLSIPLATSLTIHLFSRRNKIRLPPGPKPLPIIGNLHLLGKHPHISLTHLAKTHGPIMHLRLGCKDTVVISSSAMAKQVLQKQDQLFSNRAIANALHAHDHFKYSPVFLPVSSRWRSLRKIINSNILSVNRLDANQHLRRQKVVELIDFCRISSQNSEPVDLGCSVFRTSLNLLSNTFFSKDLTDPFSDFGKEFRDLVWNVMVEVGRPNLVDFFPFLEKFDPQGVRRRLTVYFGKILELFKELIDERVKLGKSGSTDDVIDVLLAISKESPEEMDRAYMEHLCLDLFLAGTETTSSSVEWIMAEAIKNPRIMRKLKSELEEVIGRGKFVEESDISHLPYLRCMVKETMRMHPPLPFLIPRKVDEDVEICGYIVPKDSQVFVNAWAIGRDAETWENPLEFKPERFLKSDADVRGTDFELIPFGAGRRICPGLPLAIRMVPVMAGSLFNSFDWKLEECGMELDMEEKFGITLQKANPLRAIPIPL